MIRGNRGLVMSEDAVSERAKQRAICEILARTVPADRTVRKIEEDTLERQVREITGFARDELADFLKVLADDRVDRQGPSASCMLVRKHVPLDTRKKLVGLLWEIAASDGVLHELEEAYINFVADLLEVPRRDVIAAREASQKREKPPEKVVALRHMSASVADLIAPPRAKNPRSRSYE